MTKLKIWLWIGIPTVSVVAIGVGLGVGLAKNINNSVIIIKVDYQVLSFWKSNEYSWYDSINNRTLYRYFPDKNKIGKYQILPNGNLSIISFFTNYKVV